MLCRCCYYVCVHEATLFRLPIAKRLCFAALINDGSQIDEVEVEISMAWFYSGSPLNKSADKSTSELSGTPLAINLLTLHHSRAAHVYLEANVPKARPAKHSKSVKKHNFLLI